MGNAPKTDLEELTKAWAAVEAPLDPNVKFIVGGVNLRLNVAAALKTVYLSAKLYFETKAAAFTPWTVLKVGKTVYEAVCAALEALIQKLTKPVYTLAVVLSRYDGPVAADELRRSLDEFIAGGCKADDIPWHLNITRECLDQTRQELQKPQGFETLLASLENAGMARQVDGKWEYVPRHWSWVGELEEP